MRCSASRIRAARVSGVSSARTATASCITIGPASSASSTRCTVAPATFTPCSQARRCASRPGKAGSRDGWMLTTRWGRAARNAEERRRVYPARHTRSTPCSCSAASTVRSCSSRGVPRWSHASAGMPAARARPSAGASATFEMTTATSPPSRPSCAAAMRACRFEPRPLTSTPTRFIRRRHPTRRPPTRSRRTPPPAARGSARPRGGLRAPPRRPCRSPC